MYRSSFTICVRSFVISVLVIGAAQADPATEDRVIVTATRVSQPTEEIIGSVTILTREEIEHRQPQSVQELLRGETGIDLTNTGGLGKITTTFIRGTESEHVLVLIDGVRAGSVTAGFTALEFLPVDQIERIEVVRGPRSSLYGSDAIGGVIQIFTRKGGNLVTARIGGGTEDTFQANGSLHFEVDNTSVTATLSKQSTQGFNACDGRPSNFTVTPPVSAEGCFTNEPDKDGFSSRSGSLNVNHRASFGEIELGAMFAEGHTEYDGSYQNETDFKQFAPHFKATVLPTDNWQIALTAGSTSDDQNYMHNGDPRSTYNTERQSASLQSDLKLPLNQIVTLGADFLDDTIDSTDTFTATSRDNGGVFGQYQIGIASHRISLSARHDDNQQFGSHNTGNAGWKWDIIPSLHVMAGWGTAFRAPSFNDLYSPYGGNLNLLPEKSDSYEVGVGGTIVKSWTWGINAYQTEIEDLIELNAMFEPENTAQAKIKGIEVETAVAFGDTSLSASYSYVDPRNNTPGTNYDNILQRRTQHSGRLQLAQQLGPVRLSGIVRAQGSRYNDAANRPDRELGGYTTVDVLGEYAITDQWQVDVKLTNIFDKDYATVYWFNQQGFAFLAALQYRMK